jgi:hypothetical protein
MQIRAIYFTKFEGFENGNAENQNQDILYM